ncbi:hypothetical protein C7974DRAFT_139799 [Boeremia exigua]|uniref:uncharacterized protein n=1 Tax=Boeremia exigua TaxID=749465 RepID=UPI001E8DB5DB|nr:uncharacterized protein C7974DRAFT_139799 [Boeremia exigua]KAH6639861.1 hypothetical protein C7974DRAFT_139799 [Boeremia exigua]
MSVERRQTQRQRLRIACDPCRDRKRKCDGNRPCNMCIGYGYECLYRSTPRSRRSRRGTSQSQAIAAQEENPSLVGGTPLVHQPSHDVSMRLQESRPLQERAQEQVGRPYYLRSVQSNSGAAFVRLLTMTLESTQSVSPMRMLAWNLFIGERQNTNTIQATYVTEILTEQDMQSLAAIYSAKFHPCYAFVALDRLHRDISSRWKDQDRSDARDAVLCGVAAIGSLFSNTQNLPTEQRLVVLAKRLLDPSTAGPPSLHLATAWLLHTVYLRLTAKPEEAWLASCTTLHIIDAAVSMNSVGISTIPPSYENQDINDTRKSLIGVAQHLNIWLSFDLGRRRVVIPNLDAFPLSVKPGEFTAELLGLLPFSEVLDPANKLSLDDLLVTLVEVLDRTHTEPPSVLAQCNLTLCIYRRLHSSSLVITHTVKSKVFAQLKKSIQAVHSAIAQGLPWHHVANIPFQVFCMLLFIDTVESFAILGEALACIVAVNNAYQTEATREAATAAYTLVELHRKRRETEIRNHTDMLDLYPSLDPQVQEAQDDLLSGDALQDSWWFNQFLAHPDFLGS